MAGEKPAQKTCTAEPLGYFPIDIAAVRTAEGKLSLVVAVDRACTFADAERHAEANNMVAAQFRRNVRAAIPDTIHPVLTDHGSQFTKRTRDLYAVHHIVARVCRAYGLDHRLTQTNHPWTKGQVERMNRTLQEATVKNYHEQTP
jgi:hypothetical protein